jgi:hypothetical protein
MPGANAWVKSTNRCALNTCSAAVSEAGGLGEFGGVGGSGGAASIIVPTINGARPQTLSSQRLMILRFS